VPAVDPEARVPTTGSAVSAARKARLALMLVVVLALSVAALLLLARERARERERRRNVATALLEMRRAPRELNIPRAAARWQKVKELEPANTQADELLVPLYFGSGRIREAVKQFNSLVADGVVRPAVPRTGGEKNPVAPRVGTHPDAAAATMGERDARHLAQTSLLAGMAHRITRQAAADRDRALLRTAANGNGYATLLRLSAEEPEYGPGDLAAATVQVAVHPYALLPRYEAFGRLVPCLTEAPRLSFQPVPLPDGRLPALWPVPQRTVQAYEDPARVSELNEAHLWIAAVGSSRNLLLQPGRQMESALDAADIREAIATLRDEIELVSFWQAANAYDAGEPQRAAELLMAYRRDYPTGRWTSVAGALPGGSLAQSGQTDAARQAWEETAVGRRLYGAMRAAGLLPAVGAGSGDVP